MNQDVSWQTRWQTGKIFVFFPKIVGVSSSVVGTQSDLEHLRNPTRPLTHAGGRLGAQVKAWHHVSLQKSLQKHSSASEKVSGAFLTAWEAWYADTQGV